MKELKITKTNKLNALIAVLDNIEMDSVIITAGETDIEVTKEDLIAYCEGEIEALAKKAAKAKENAAKKKTEDPLLTLVEAALTAEPQTIADIATKVAETDADATPSKVTYRLKVLVDNGVAVKSDASVPTADGKKRTVKAYALADAE